jgi:SAM-dependent methyltransferase
MDPRSHWENVYSTKAPEAVSWYRPHLDKSIEIIEKTAPDRFISIIDIGGGESTLVDDLLARGYEDLTVLDISSTAIEVAQRRLGDSARLVKWIAGDITNAVLPPQSYNFWHDRAVFHFLTTADQRSAYVRQVEKAVRSGGNLLISTFGPEGPTKCSGLEVVRYDADSLHREFGVRFRLLESFKEVHHTPFGTTQQFLYCLCRVD